jgi:hypothetical protein
MISRVPGPSWVPGIPVPITGTLETFSGMTLQQLQFRRTWVGRVGAGLCLFLFLVIIDALAARFREPPNRLAGWPGAVLPVNGLLADQIEGKEELSYQTPSPALRLEFEGLQKGFWLGGNQWNGRLHIRGDIRPGRYPLAVIHKRPEKGQAEGRAYFYQVEVYPDPLALGKNSKSFFRSRFGLRVGYAVAFLLPFIILSFGMVFYFSRKAEDYLAAEGKGEIYRVRKDGNGWILHFTLGERHGLQPGQTLTVTDQGGRTLGKAVTTEVFPDHSSARLSADTEAVRPGDFVSR